MRDNQSNIVIEEVIQASMKMTDVPDPELNQKLKAALYQQEAVLQKQPATQKETKTNNPIINNLNTYT